MKLRMSKIIRQLKRWHCLVFVIVKYFPMQRLVRFFTFPDLAVLVLQKIKEPQPLRILDINPAAKDLKRII